MRSSPVEAALRDIRRHIALAIAFVADAGPEEFRNDMRTVYAVTRCLEIISEASRRLPEDVKARHPDIAWKQIAGAGNIYRHEYEDVAAPMIWNTVVFALPALGMVVETEIARLS